MTDEKRYTLAEVREKERAAFVRACLVTGSMSYNDAEREARERFPLPSPLPPEPERPTVTRGDWTFRLNEDGRTVDGRRPDAQTWHALYDVDHVRTLASLLSRVPVKITEAMVEKAVEAFQDVDRRTYGSALPVEKCIRAALSAVAADLAQPVQACQHKAKWWGTVGRDGSTMSHRDEAEARNRAASYDQHYPECAPHRVIKLAEVE